MADAVYFATPDKGKRPKTPFAALVVAGRSAWSGTVLFYSDDYKTRVITPKDRGRVELTLAALTAPPSGWLDRMFGANRTTGQNCTGRAGIFRRPSQVCTRSRGCGRQARDLEASRSAARVHLGDVTRPRSGSSRACCAGLGDAVLPWRQPEPGRVRALPRPQIVSMPRLCGRRQGDGRVHAEEAA